MPQNPELKEGVHFYWEGSRMVFTAQYLLERGYCCESGCRHCPYGFGPEGAERRRREQQEFLEGGRSKK